MKTYSDNWLKVNRSSPAPVLGEQCTIEPEAANVSLENLLYHFYSGYDELREIWKVILREENLREIDDVYNSGKERLTFSSGLWVRVVYDFAVAYNFCDLNRDLVVDSLLPLYCARTAYFIMKTRSLSSFEAEIEVESCADTFEALKDYLRYFWQLAAGDGS